MKKKLLISICFALVAASAVTFFQTSGTPSKASLLLQNTEALAESEKDGLWHDCYSEILYKAGSSVRFCGSCTIIQNAQAYRPGMMDMCK